MVVGRAGPTDAAGSAPYFLKMSAGVHAVAQGLVHGLALAVHGPAVGDALLEGSALSQRAYGGEEAGLEPARGTDPDPPGTCRQARSPGPSSWRRSGWSRSRNQPSRVSSSLVKGPLLPQWGQVKPSGRISAAESSYQALEPFSAKSLETAAMVSSVQMGLPQSGQ